MLYAFIDESYTKDKYYVAAVIADEAHLIAVRDALQATREYARGFGVLTPDIEFHAHSLMAGCDGWHAIKGAPRAAIAIYGHVLQQLAALPVKIIVRGVDIQRLNARYKYPEAPHAVTLRHLLEQIDKYAESAGDVVTVIADEIQGQAEHVFMGMQYQRTGTGGYKPRLLKQIQMPIVFGSSSESPGIQCADLTAYIYRRLDAHVETHARTAVAVQRLWGILDPCTHHVWRWDP